MPQHIPESFLTYCFVEIFFNQQGKDRLTTRIRVVQTKKTHSQPDFAAAALSSCHPVADQRRRPSCRGMVPFPKLPGILKATHFKASSRILRHSVVALLCETSAPPPGVGILEKNNMMLSQNELHSIHIIYYTHIYIL